jgi:hypothetical protein
MTATASLPPQAYPILDFAANRDSGSCPSPLPSNPAGRGENKRLKSLQEKHGILRYNPQNNGNWIIINNWINYKNNYFGEKRRSTEMIRIG